MRNWNKILLEKKDKEDNNTGRNLFLLGVTGLAVNRLSHMYRSNEQRKEALHNKELLYMNHDRHFDFSKHCNKGLGASHEKASLTPFNTDD